MLKRSYWPPSYFVWTLFFLFCLVGLGRIEAAGTWRHLKDSHFIVFYNFQEDHTPASIVLQKAEEYYRKIANQIGYSRYSNFWTWDARVKIIIFPDQQSFMQNTGQPAWSRGYSSRDSELFKSRIIVTYRQEENFIEGVLPHEIAHLILRDFIGFETQVPLWFEEGVAQLQESAITERADHYLRGMVKRKQYIPFNLMMQWDIRKESDPLKVSLFYLQSVSMIDFLIKNYGSGSFGYFCRSLKDGKPFEHAMRAAYTTSLNTTQDMERRWVEYLKR